MKKIFMFICTAFLFTTCNDRGTEKSTISDTTKIQEQDKATTKVQEQDKTTTVKPFDEETLKFVMAAINGGMMEVELGTLAKQNARNQRVKDFGTMMVKDHTKANDELRAIATSHDLTLPAAPDSIHRQHKEKLAKKTTGAFDREYMKMMVEDHTTTIKKFEKAARSANTHIKAFAERTLPTIRMHLDSAKAISKLKL